MVDRCVCVFIGWVLIFGVSVYLAAHIRTHTHINNRPTNPVPLPLPFPHLLPRHPAGPMQVQGGGFPHPKHRVFGQGDELRGDEVPAQIGPQRVGEVVEEFGLCVWFVLWRVFGLFCVCVCVWLCVCWGFVGRVGVGRCGVTPSSDPPTPTRMYIYIHP